MNSVTLSNILTAAAPGNGGFAIYGEVETENDYNSNVVFNTPSEKPAWSAVQAGQAIEQWVVIRAQRNAKLLDCDWTQLGDVPITDAKLEEWQTYRQALRDITNQSDPFNITWPTPPA